MVTAAELLGIGSGGGGSSTIESTVKVGSSIAAGQSVSVNAAGEFIPFDGSLPLFGVSSVAAGSGATLTITSTAAFAGTVATFAAAADLNGEVTEIDISSAVIDTGNTGTFTGNNSIQISADGTKVITLENTNFNTRTLSTAFDLTSAGANTAVSTAAQDSLMAGLCFGKAGTKMYAVGLTNDRVYEYDVATPYDISTLTFVGFLALAAVSWAGVSISDDGNYVLLINDTGDTFVMYTLGTSFSISTGALTSTSPVVSAQMKDCHIGPSGDTVYLVNGSGANSLQEYSVSTPYDLTTLNTTPVNTFVGPSFAEGVAITADKTKFILHPTAQLYDNTPVTTAVTIDSGLFVYSDASGQLTTADTGNFVGFKVGPTQLIFTEEPA